ncbi:hypothetical protein P4B35_10275 [Pontiellaceae bacterium B12227]|nr:hypothetical protein [Pontiellaceae bacterium B12227]
MKTLMVLILALAMAAAVAVAPSEEIITKAESQEFRVFRNAEGKTVRGRIVKYNPEKETVIIETEDRKVRTVKLDDLSETDQAYVRDWKPVPFSDFISPKHFIISARRRRLAGAVEYLIWRPEETVVYDITLKNRCDFNLENLTLDYCIYYKTTEPNIRGAQPDIGVKRGRRHIKRVARRGNTRLATEPVTFPTEDLFEYYKDGEAPPLKLQGIRIRVYLPLGDGRKAMREYANPDNLIKDYRWSEP